MSDYLKIVRHIVPSYLLATLVTVGGLLLVRYLFTIWFQVFELKESVWELWLPIAVGGLWAALWMRPKFKILQFESKQSERRDLCLFVSAAVIIGTSIFFQMNLPKALGALEKVDHVADIPLSGPQRYYALSQFGVNEWRGGSHVDFRIYGRHNESLGVTIFHVLPFSKGGEEVGAEEGRWYGVKFEKSMSNRLSDYEKEKIYQQFWEETTRKISRYSVANVTYFERVPASDDLDGFLKAVARDPGASEVTETIVLLGMRHPFEDRSGASLGFAPWLFFGGSAIFLLILSFPKVNGAHLALADGDSRRRPFYERLPGLLLVGKEAPISLIYVVLIFGVFGLMVFLGVHPLSPTAGELLEWGGNRRFETLSGDWWRLMSSAFVHGGVIHLVGNWVGLVLAGMWLEPYIKRSKVVLIYLVSGICAAVASIWWHDHSVSVGASGAILGIFGGGLVMSWLFRDGPFSSGLISLYIGANLLIGVFVGAVDNAAHVGGLIAGMVLTIILHFSRVIQLIRSN